MHIAIDSLAWKRDVTVNNAGFHTEATSYTSYIVHREPLTFSGEKKTCLPNYGEIIQIDMIYNSYNKKCWMNGIPNEKNKIKMKERSISRRSEHTFVSDYIGIFLLKKYNTPFHSINSIHLYLRIMQLNHFTEFIHSPTLNDGMQCPTGTCFLAKKQILI